MLSMLSVYKKALFLFLLLIALISIFVLNLFTVLDSDNKYKTIVGNICQQLSDNNNGFNYTLKRRPLNRNIRRDSVNKNGFETSFVNISDNIFIYSAFEKSNNIIVLIGFAKNCEEVAEDYNFNNYNNSYKVEDYDYFCGFGGKVLIKSQAVVEYLPESHDFYYSAIKVQCKRPQFVDQNLSINSVKLIERPKLLDKSVANNKTIESEFVFIVKNKKNKSIFNNNSNYGLGYSQGSNRGTGSHRTPRPFDASPKELVVCVRPLYGNISAINLLEFIAYYRLNGINRLVFYNSIRATNMTKSTKLLFQLLSSIDSVEVLPFILPDNDESRPMIHAKGQLTAVHDCLHRYSDYIQIHVDFDEYLFSLTNKTIKEFLSSDNIRESSAPALVVPTVIFCNEFNKQLAKRSDPLLISSYYRQKTIWPHQIRSKVIIIRAELISQMGIHKVWQLYFRPKKSHPIWYSKPNELLIYHYRKCCDMIQPYFAHIIHFHTINDYIVRDESIKPFVNRVKQFIDKYIEIIN